MKKIFELLSGPWAIRPETLQTMISVYERHAAGELPDLKAIEAALGRPLNNEPRPYEVQDGVAVINVQGILAKRMDMFTEISGGSSTQRLQSEFQEAMADPEVHSILLAVDSPGGSVDGTQGLASEIFAARGQKPIVTLADGDMGSGAYWIGSAADRVFISSDTDQVGSIGVVTSHTDISRAQEMRGVRTTEITAGKYKRVASQYQPLSADGRQVLQDMVDHTYSVFVNDVARNRGVSAETVLKDMADGRVFQGKQAIAAGLVDGMTTMRKLMEQMRLKKSPAAITGALAAPENGGVNMKADKEDTAAQAVLPGVEQPGPGPKKETAAATVAAAAPAPAKPAENTADVAAQVKTAREAGYAEGVTAERTRILAIQSYSLPGHEALVASLVADGTPAETAAARILTAEREARIQRGKDLKADAPPPVPAAAPPEGAGSGKTVSNDRARELAGEAQQYQEAQAKEGNKLTIAQATKHVYQKHGLPLQ